MQVKGFIITILTGPKWKPCLDDWAGSYPP